MAVGEPAAEMQRAQGPIDSEDAQRRLVIDHDRDRRQADERCERVRHRLRAAQHRDRGIVAAGSFTSEIWEAAHSTVPVGR